jgi:hypothetical protein
LSATDRKSGGAIRRGAGLKAFGAENQLQKFDIEAKVIDDQQLRGHDPPEVLSV